MAYSACIQVLEKIENIATSIRCLNLKLYNDFIVLTNASNTSPNKTSTSPVYTD